jgi:hypothetical protein
VTKSDFINNSKLTRADINQTGGWRNFKDNAGGMAYSIDGALAWYASEEIARRYVDELEG